MTPAPTITEPTESHRRSKGERMFDWLTYGGIAGVATFLLSIPVGFLVRYDPRGISAVKWMAGHMKKVGLSESVAENVVMTTALMQGGNATILPVKMMEDRKPELVEKYNQMLGDNQKAQDVNCEAKQTWSSLIKSRVFLAWLPVFGSLWGAQALAGKERFANFEKKFSEYLLCKPLRQATHNAQGAETTLFKVGRIAALDVFATTAAAVLLYVGSRFFAKSEKQETVCEPKPGKEKEAVPSAPISLPPENTRAFTDGLTARKNGFADAVTGEKSRASDTPLGVSA